MNEYSQFYSQLSAVNGFILARSFEHIQKKPEVFCFSSEREKLDNKNCVKFREVVVT